MDLKIFIAKEISIMLTQKGKEATFFPPDFI